MIIDGAVFSFVDGVERFGMHECIEAYTPLVRDDTGRLGVIIKGPEPSDWINNDR